MLDSRLVLGSVDISTQPKEKASIRKPGRTGNQEEAEDGDSTVLLSEARGFTLCGHEKFLRVSGGQRYGGGGSETSGRASVGHGTPARRPVPLWLLLSPPQVELKCQQNLVHVGLTP